MRINHLKRTIQSLVLVTSLLMFGCSTSDFTRVKTTGGYLSETKVALPERISEDIGRIVFLRKEASSQHTPTVFINDRVIGSLPPERYSESLVCPGEQTIRIDTRTETNLHGADQLFSVPAGTTQYLQVYETNDTDFGVRVLSEDQVKELSKGLSQSHIINRHQPICNAPLKVIKNINLAADALFKFDSTQMIPSGQARVDKLIRDIQSMGAQVEQIRIIGHTDRLGAVAYNDRLSQERAKTVALYMKQHGLNIPTVTEGRGSREPVTNGCKNQTNARKLIQCLQPDRRVSIDLMGTVEQIENKGISSK